MIVRERKIRVHFDRLTALVNRFIGEMGNEQQLRQIGVDDQGERIEVLRFLHFAHVMTAHFGATRMIAEHEDLADADEALALDSTP